MLAALEPIKSKILSPCTYTRKNLLLCSLNNHTAISKIYIANEQGVRIYLLYKICTIFVYTYTVLMEK